MPLLAFMGGLPTSTELLPNTAPMAAIIDMLPLVPAWVVGGAFLLPSLLLDGLGGRGGPQGGWDFGAK
jgi:hypothetical protein